MPRRKIGADLKEALCKLYEAGDISADTIEKHGIMSRATFFRNLKMYKTGASLEQRHSTGRKTNADKLKEQEKQELDLLQPAHLSHLELVLLLDDDERNVQSLAARNKRKAKASAASLKKREIGKGVAADAQTYNVTVSGDDSGSESDGESDESASVASRQALDKLTQAARSFLASSDSNDPSGFNSSEPFADLDSLLKPEDSHFSHSNRGALYIVRRRTENRGEDGTGEIVAAMALRSLIWTPQIYQALGSSYSSRSIDKICNLARLRVGPTWQRKGVGRWLVSAAEHKASKLGFSHLYTQSDASGAELLSFWRSTGFNEFARLDNVARLEKVVVALATPSKSENSKQKARSPPVSIRATRAPSPSGTTPAASSFEDGVAEGTGSNAKRTDARLPVTRLSPGQSNLLSVEIDPAIPMGLPATAVPLSSFSGVPYSNTVPEMGPQSRPLGSQPHAVSPAPTSTPLSFRNPTSPTLMGPNLTSTPTLASQSPQDPTDIPGGPPPRKIAFHEADSVASRPRA